MRARTPPRSARGRRPSRRRLSWTVGSLRHRLPASVTPPTTYALRGLAAEEPGVIVVDGVYGNGACGRVAEAAAVAEETGGVLVVDETHSFGCAAGGLGVCEEAGVSHRVHFRTVGLSKAFASRGGIIIGPSRALEAFRFVDRQMIFSTAPLEHEIVGYATTLDVLLRDDWRRDALNANHARLRHGLLSLGYTDDVQRSAPDPRSHGRRADDDRLPQLPGRAGRLRLRLRRRRARGASYLRFTVNSGDAQVDRFLEVLGAARHILRAWS